MLMQGGMVHCLSVIWLEQDLAEVNRSDFVSVTQSKNLLGFAVASGGGCG